MADKNTSPRLDTIENIIKELGKYMEASGVGAQGVADILETSGKMLLEGVSVKVTLTHCGGKD